MKFNTGLPSSVVPHSEESSQSTNTKCYGRVVEVVMDMSHPKIKSLGGTQALYGLFYQPLFVDAEEEIPLWGRRFAYCGHSTLKQIPIKGEIVRLEIKPSSALSEAGFNADGTVYKLCWTEIVPLWNTPHLNAYPDNPNRDKPDYGKDFKEDEKIKPLQLCPGDVTIEGRHGQSLRFGGTKFKLSTIATDESNGKPYTILRNGQADCSKDTCFEDVDKDDSSIYLTSDHKVPVTEANRKFKGATSIPPLARNYRGKQIVVNSDRVTVNARENNLVLAAKKHASINAETTSIDGERYVGLDAKKIYLGTSAQTELEPVLLGQTTITKLQNLCNSILIPLAMRLGVPGQTAWENQVAAQAQVAVQALIQWVSGLPKLESKKVFTE